MVMSQTVPPLESPPGVLCANLLILKQILIVKAQLNPTQLSTNIFVNFGLGIWELGFGIPNLGFRIWGLGSVTWNPVFGIEDLGLRIWDLDSS